MSNKSKFEYLLKTCCLTQTRAAQVISEITKRPLSARAVRAWLTDPSKASYRSCPDWPIEALEEYQRRPIVYDDEIENNPDLSSKLVNVSVDPNSLPIAPGIPYSMNELDAAFTAAFFEPPQKSNRRSPKVQQDYENVRYRCPECKIQVWGAPNLIIGCNTCDEPMIDMRD